MTKREEVVEEIAAVLNKHSMENESDTPDFILAEYLVSCLEAFDRAAERRRIWYLPEG